MPPARHSTTSLNEHYADYSCLFRSVSLSLNNASATDDMPVNERLARYREGKSDFYLEQLYYQFGRYLLIASSRPGNLPPTCKDCGTTTWTVRGVNYHNNINLQMNYWPACPTGLQQCELPLFDFIQGIIKPGERTAKSYYGTRGWTTSVSGNIFGFTTPLESEDMSWNFSPFAGPWLATHLELLRLHTRHPLPAQQGLRHNQRQRTFSSPTTSGTAPTESIQLRHRHRPSTDPSMKEPHSHTP